MRTSVVERGGARIVVCDDDIAAVDEALALIGACFEHDSTRLLIDAKHLPAAFFELRSRFAGEFIQKLANYRLRVAACFDSGPERSARFEEFLREAKRSQDFRAFTNREDAEIWLAEA
jgi:hypothetical protein